MQAKLFDSFEYVETHMQWWKIVNKQDFDPKKVSQHGIVVINDVGAPMCLCFLYFPSNSKMCQLAFVVRNPNISYLLAGRSLKLLVSFSMHASRALGYDILYSATENVVVSKALSRARFFKGKTSSQEFFKEL